MSDASIKARGRSPKEYYRYRAGRRLEANLHVTEPKPKRYVVYYINSVKWQKEAARVGEESVDPAWVEESEEVDTISAARAIRRRLERTKAGNEIRIFERVNLHTTTRGDSDFRITEWEGDEELVED